MSLVVAGSQPGLADGDCGNVAAVVRLGVLAACLRVGVCPDSDCAAVALAGLAGKPPLGLTLGLTVGLGNPLGLGLGKPDGLGLGVGKPGGLGFGLGHTTLPFHFPWPLPLPLPLPKTNLHLGFVFGSGLAWIHLLMPATFSG